MYASPATGPVATDVVIVGAGPVALYLVFQLGLQGLRCHVVDSLPHAGGQCVELYGDKTIYDIPALSACSGVELIGRLRQQTAPFAPQWHWGQTVTALSAQTDGRWLVQTPQQQWLARAVCIAAGVGAFLPRPLKVPGLERFEGTQVLYRVEDLAALSGSQVVVHGGDEPAVAQAVACARVTADAPARIVLQHRRDVFDAPDPLLAELQALRAVGRIEVVVGTVTGVESTDSRLSALQLLSPEGEAQSLPLDFLVVRLGLAPRLGPLLDWGLALERKQLLVNTATFATDLTGVYAVGDIVSYPGKRRLMVCGFHEATLAAFAIAEQLAGQKIPLEYTSSSVRLQQRLFPTAPQP